MVACLVILGEDGAERPVDRAEHHGMGDRLDGLARTRREGKEETRGQEDEEDNGDEDVRIKGSHLFLRQK